MLRCCDEVILNQINLELNLFKVLFVDDEDIIREGFTSRIQWEELGYEFHGAFENGKEVVDYLKIHSVDLIVSDICMPKIDGLELSKIVSTLYPCIKILLLTGYDDFEYAREAIKYDSILELILKPVTSIEFTQILKKTAVKLSSLHSKIRDRAILEEKLQKSFPLLKKRFLYRMAGGKMSLKEWNQRKDFIQLKDLEKSYQILIIYVSPEEDEITRLEKEEIVNSTIKSPNELFQNRDEQIVLFLQGDNIKDLYSSTQILAENILTNLERYYSEIQPLIGIGQPVESIEELKVSYSGAKNSIDYLKLTGTTGIQHISSLRNKNRPSPEWRRGMENSFSEFLYGEKTGSIEEFIDAYFSRLKEYYITPKDPFLYTNRLFFILLGFIEDAELLTEEEKEKMLSNLKDDSDWESIDEATLWIKERVRETSKIIKEKKSNITIKRLSKAKQLIEEHFNRYDFSLHQICKDLYISPSYFSSIFKEGTGKTFIEYLTAIRIEKAKIMLKTTELKTYEIAEQVGYRDPGYFSSIFKKDTLMTTSEFRNSFE